MAATVDSFREIVPEIGQAGRSLGWEEEAWPNLLAARVVMTTWQRQRCRLFNPACSRKRPSPGATNTIPTRTRCFTRHV